MKHVLKRGIFQIQLLLTSQARVVVIISLMCSFYHRPNVDDLGNAYFYNCLLQPAVPDL